MSHLVVIETRVHDAAALTAACRRLGLAEPVHGNVQFFSGDATGLSVKLPSWQYPIVVDTAEGSISRRNRGPQGCPRPAADHDRTTGSASLKQPSP